jgi:hypothetical protein
MGQAHVSRLERGQLAHLNYRLRIETCIKFAEAVGCVYRGTLRRGGRRVTGLSELNISELNDFTLEECAKFAIAVGCVYVSELLPTGE